MGFAPYCSDNLSYSTEIKFTIIRMDVHAKIYTPHVFKVINELPCVTVPSQSHKPIDYEKYVVDFSGNLFLRPPSATLPHIPPDTANPEHSQPLQPGTYYSTFQRGLLEEYNAHVENNACFNMYNTLLTPYDLANALYVIHVPGLLEGAPEVSVGDIVWLRQLILDPATNLPAKTVVRTNKGDFRENYTLGFTGLQLEAVAWGFIRMEEKMILHVAGVSPHGSSNFNVMFPVQIRHVMALQRALDTTVRYLRSSDDQAQAPGRETSRHSQTSSPSAPEQHQFNSVWMHNMLFPTEENGRLTHTHPKGKFKQAWIDKILNYEQKKAIDAIQSQEYGTLPFLLSGIPGSGKTKAVVEAILQMVRSNSNPGSILVCAPSDQAADNLALRLKKALTTKEMLRLNHHSRTFQSVPSPILAWTYVLEDTFALPPFPQLMAYDVVVTTCKDADILVQARVTNSDLATWQHHLNQTIGPRSRDALEQAVSLHWSALFIDEAAQATETEALIPLSVVAPPTDLRVEQEPIFVIIGDPNQLGPKLYSSNKDLSLSLLERLIALPLYANHPLARHSGRKDRKITFPMVVPPFVNFNRNYRSHQAILAVPSSLFYSNTLIPESSDSKRSMTGWPGWKGRGWPVMFMCNYGSETCQDVHVSSESWTNQQEALMATNVAQSFLQSGRIQERDLCIMAPFAAQVRLIRNMCRAKGLHRCNIGPDIVFQGLEFPVVIICTTRTTSRFLVDDRRKGVGFIDNFKKLNVAITRAEDGLVVIGNPFTLSQDRCWHAFMTYCWRNGLWYDDGNSSSEADGGSERHWQPRKDLDFPVQGLEAAMVYREDVVPDQMEAVEGAMAGISMRGKTPLRAYSDHDPMIASGIAAEEYLRAQETYKTIAQHDI